MVATVTSLGRSGLHDWVIQRLSALVMLAYALYIVYFVVSTGDITYEAWHGLFATTFMKVFTLVTLLSMVFHMWIGMWIVSTDYMPKLSIRFTFQLIMIVYCLALIIWGIQVIGSI
ncbi:MAG: succinate dehydrogenase, hydrophobic membrane anchor protein [Kangiellaceae bacterium]|nr:succinate dehydrogenase, hydrophobic membrane anchor protein [Kangiellaceae bacterium]